MASKSKAFSGMPAWVADSLIDPSWVEENIPDLQNISECAVKDISNDNRKGDTAKNGATLLLRVKSRDRDEQKECTEAEKAPITLVAKQVPSAGMALSHRLGLAREAMFYNHLASKINNLSEGISASNKACIPKIYYSYGDMSNGSKFIVMEDLSGSYVDSGILFGPGNPNNWNRDLNRSIANAYHMAIPTSFEVANQTFLAIAQVHAAFWKDTELLKDEYSWLRGSSWINGKGEESWRASQGMLQTMWETYTNSEGIEDADEGVRWDPFVRQIVSKSMEGISWDSHLRRLNAKSHFCLVHGDFWPGNVMISKDKHTADKEEFQNLRLLDWEMVGGSIIPCNPQSLEYTFTRADQLFCTCIRS